MTDDSSTQLQHWLQLLPPHSTNRLSFAPPKSNTRIANNILFTIQSHTWLRSTGSFHSGYRLPPTSSTMAPIGIVWAPFEYHCAIKHARRYILPTWLHCIQYSSLAACYQQEKHPCKQNWDDPVRRQAGCVPPVLTKTENDQTASQIDGPHAYEESVRGSLHDICVVLPREVYFSRPYWIL